MITKQFPNGIILSKDGLGHQFANHFLFTYNPEQYIA